jgi:hypothetical protein
MDVEDVSDDHPAPSGFFVWPEGTPLATRVVSADTIAALRFRIAMAELARFMTFVECEAWANHWAAEWEPRIALTGAREEQLTRALLAGQIRVVWP